MDIIRQVCETSVQYSCMTLYIENSRTNLTCISSKISWPKSTVRQQYSTFGVKFC
nr:unnamed protein product [Callosobruchus analis]